MVHTLCKGKIKQLYTIGGLSTDKIKVSEVKDRIAQIHDFEKFFSRIKSDSLYQRERVKYPLSVLWVGFQENDTIVYVHKHEYSNISYDEPHFYNSIFSPNENTIIVNLQMEGSGVSIDYFYKEDGESWYLDHVKDSSM